MSVATQTANGKYKYSDLYPHKNGKPLADWVQEVNKLNCIANKWKVNPLKPGGFGYDNLATCIANLFESGVSLNETNIEELADVIHRGWVINYTYWRDNTPWSGNVNYTKPAAALGDERRNKCAVTDYADLPEDEKVKDRDIAKFIIAIFETIPKIVNDSAMTPYAN